MSRVVSPLVDPPILFAAGGAARHAQPDTSEAVNLGFRLGASALWGEVHRGDETLSLGPPPRRFRSRRAVPLALTAVAAIFDANDHVLGLVTNELTDAKEVLAIARKSAFVDRLWLVSADMDLLSSVRAESPAVRLLHRGNPTDQQGGAERHAARLREMSIDGVAAPEQGLTAGTVALLHRFSRVVVAEGADHLRMARRALENGVDGVTGTDVDALVSAQRDAVL